jgi:hypothetical protein
MNRAERYWSEGDRVNTQDGRPGPGSVHGTIVSFGHVLTGIRPDPDDPNFSKVRDIDENGLVWRYEHDIWAPEDSSP